MPINCSLTPLSLTILLVLSGQGHGIPAVPNVKLVIATVFNGRSRGRNFQILLFNGRLAHPLLPVHRRLALALLEHAWRWRLNQSVYPPRLRPLHLFAFLALRRARQRVDAGCGFGGSQRRVVASRDLSHLLDLFENVAARRGVGGPVAHGRGALAALAGRRRRLEGVLAEDLFESVFLQPRPRGEGALRRVSLDARRVAGRGQGVPLLSLPLPGPRPAGHLGLAAHRVSPRCRGRFFNFGGGDGGEVSGKGLGLVLVRRHHRVHGRLSPVEHVEEGGGEVAAAGLVALLLLLVGRHAPRYRVVIGRKFVHSS